MRSADRIRTLPTPSLKRRALWAAERAMYLSGAARLYTAMHGGGAVILMYHSVADAPHARFVDPAWHMSPQAFEAQLRWLKRHRTIVSLDALLDTLERGEAPAPGTVVLTFDDGYVDNLTVAAPILARYDAPATIYLATGYVSAGESQWVDRLYTLFRSRQRDALCVPGRSYDLSSGAERLRAYLEVSGMLITARRPDREALLAELYAQLAPAELTPRLTLTWPEAKRLADGYRDIGLGVHTVDHTDMSGCDLERARQQMVDARTQIEAHTGREAKHFSFPYSRTTPATRALVQALGYRSATGSSEAFLVRPGTDPYDLPRVDPRTDPTLLKFWTSGAFPGLPQSLLGRA
jgi:peptidoglycan/xylan/chitin deacetylase (PgdA/CDA1 family)